MTFDSVCLSVCPQHNSKTKVPKVLKLGIGNDLGLSYKWYGFGIERSKVRASVFSNTVWVRTLPSTLNIVFGVFVCLALVLVRPNGHLLSPELGSSFGGGGSGDGGSSGGSGTVIRTGLYPRSTASAALHYAHSTPRVNAGDLTQPSLQAGRNWILKYVHQSINICFINVWSKTDE